MGQELDSSGSKNAARGAGVQPGGCRARGSNTVVKDAHEVAMPLWEKHFLGSCFTATDHRGISCCPITQGGGLCPHHCREENHIKWLRRSEGQRARSAGASSAIHSDPGS